MKKLIVIGLAFVAISSMAQVNDHANKIAETVNPNYCTTSDGQPGTLRRTSATVTSSTSSTNSSSQSSSYGSSSSTSTSVKAGISGFKPEASVTGTISNSTSNNQSSTTGNSSTSGATRQDNYQCFPYSR